MSTFTIGGTVATFRTMIRGSGQESPEPERMTLGCFFESDAEWDDMVTLITSKYHVHLPLGGNAVIDVARGPGTGALVIDGFASTTALLVDLRATDYLPGGARRLGTAVFIRTAAWA